MQHIYSTGRAFAALLKNGSVVAWGNPRFGGDSSSVKTKPQNAKEIYSTGRAFAALLTDGCVVTWGDANFGGEIPDNIRGQIK